MIGLAVTYHVTHSFICRSLGQSYLLLGDVGKAIDFWQQELEVLQSFLRPPHADVALCHEKLDEAYAQQRKFGKAIEHFDIALDMRLALNKLEV